ncbi:MAG: rubrerythrin family protein [Deltaproteobacteria bacterium]|jgi:rubrerythrin|nr:rubrerythrin family protein [Deltaproteobacteria bacterium]
MTKTDKNLMDAFAGESQANRKYLAYAAQADKEGFPQAARLFRAAAAAETIHSHAHLRNAGKVRDTLGNLRDALEGETHEYTSMYPQMIKEAQEEGNKAVAQYLQWVNKVEEVHAGLYKKALDAGGRAENVDYYLCPVCGYTHEGPLSGKCPVCGAPGASLKKTD